VQQVQRQVDHAEALEKAMQRIRETTSLNGIDEFLDRFIQVKGAQL
jgi:hypothetical protein